MLVFTREENREIQIGDDISITVEKIGKNRVKIGIKAPQHASIKRGELLDGFEMASDLADHRKVSDDPDDPYADHPGPYNPDYEVPQSNLT